MTIARCFVCLVLAACSKSERASPVAVTPDKAGLAQLFAQARAACEAQDHAKGKAIVASIIPTRDAARTALREGVSASLIDQIVAQSSEIPGDEAKAACVLSPPGRTEILVHEAKTEAILAYEPNTLVSMEFPAGAKSLAPLLRPAMSFFEVEAVEPGSDKGTKFHMFFWDGTQWRMLGPAWRYLSDAR